MITTVWAWLAVFIFTAFWIKQIIKYLKVYSFLGNIFRFIYLVACAGLLIYFDFMVYVLFFIAYYSLLHYYSNKMSKPETLIKVTQVPKKHKNTRFGNMLKHLFEFKYFSLMLTLLSFAITILKFGIVYKLNCIH